MELLFVYGTLTDQNHNEVASFLHKNGTVAGEGSFSGRLYNVGGYPGAVYHPETTETVNGIIVRLNEPETVFEKLDEYEGVGGQFPAPNEYIRVQIPVQNHNGETHLCWVYLYNWPTENLQHIQSGRYD
jgi:gamma-glutamylcyclotransferase (GGCT)/AIG2-like uncharacterized protein YtfP